MPKLSVSERLDGVLYHLNVPRDLHRKIMNCMYSPSSTFTADQKKAVRTDAAWNGLLGNVRAVLRGVKSNANKQPAYTRDAYIRYIEAITQARDDIMAASQMLLKDKNDPDGPKVPATLDDIKRLAAKRNKATNTDGPTCTSRWQTWIAPSLRTEIRNSFDIAYTKADRGSGKRVTPFLTPDIVAYNVERMQLLRDFIDVQRSKLSLVWPTDHPQSNEPYNALHLAALRMAERALNAWDKAFARDKYHALDNPLPVTWLPLLTADMRERIREADLNPRDVTIYGIESFYVDDGSDRKPAVQAAHKRETDWD